MKPKVEYFKDKKGEVRWHVQAANGEIVAQGEGHRDEADARRAAQEALRTFEQAVEDEFRDSPDRPEDVVE